MVNKKLFKKIPYEMRGDILAVELRDQFHNKFYKKEVKARDNEEIRRMKDELKSKGVDL